MLSTLFGARVRQFTIALGRPLVRAGISPNMVTVSGLLFNAFVAIVLAGGHYFWGGVLTLLAGVFDMLDGAVARAGNKVSVFGGFLDSTLDRYSEAVLLFGLLYHFQQIDNTTATALVYITFVGSIMTSYTRARSEAAGLTNDAGFFQRTERVVLLGVCLLFRIPVAALWILAIGTNLTALYRVYTVYRTTGA